MGNRACVSVGEVTYSVQFRAVNLRLSWVITLRLKGNQIRFVADGRERMIICFKII
jgi:hypothetical protein